MSEWIDFKALRRDLNFRQVLEHYGVEVRIKGDRANAFCPLPRHHGQRRSASFSADLRRGLFQCFGCGTKGNLIEFACYMEEVNPNVPKEFHRVAMMLKERFLGGSQSDSRREKPPSQKRNGVDGRARKPEANRNAAALPVVVNAPLDFELKDLDRKHPYLTARGLTPNAIEHFGLGFANRGSLKGRIAIPLHDPEGKLVGYAGRLVDDRAINEENPKYKFPSPREHDGKRHEFRKNLILYNFSGVGKPVANLIVVEGFPSVWWLWECGHENVVALMGASCSPEQATLIGRLLKPTGRMWLLSDGDEAGDRCTQSVLPQVARHHSVRWIKLPAGKQPTDCTATDFERFFGNRARKSGTSDQPTVTELGGTSDERPGDPTAADE